MYDPSLTVGDIVQIREDLVVGDYPCRGLRTVFCNEDMTHHSGRVMTIVEVIDENMYKLEEDPRKWTWTQSMFTENYQSEMQAISLPDILPWEFGEEEDG